MTDEDQFAELHPLLDALRGAAIAAGEAIDRRHSAEDAVLALVSDTYLAGLDPRSGGFRSMLRRLHYETPDVSSSALAAAAGFVDKNGKGNVPNLARAIGEYVTDEKCVRCGVSLTTASSYGMYRDKCGDCRETEQRERRAGSARNGQRWLHVENGDLVEPVKHWRAVVAVILAYPPALSSDVDERSLAAHYFEMAQELRKRISDMPQEAEVPIRLRDAIGLTDAYRRAIDWDAERACSLIAPHTDRLPSHLLAHLERHIKGRAAELEADAARLFPEPEIS